MESTTSSGIAGIDDLDLLDGHPEAAAATQNREDPATAGLWPVFSGLLLAFILATNQPNFFDWIRLGFPHVKVRESNPSHSTRTGIAPRRPGTNSTGLGVRPFMSKTRQHRRP